MDLKSPVKKGYKTAPNHPPLPILNESPSGLIADEYDWPIFNGYYNGTSVIVDDIHAISVLTTKGSFGKGSLSRGCLNLGKRKIPYNVVYESQWKRRKKWIECLNNLLKNRGVPTDTIEHQITKDFSEILEERDNFEKNKGVPAGITDQKSINDSTEILEKREDEEKLKTDCVEESNCEENVVDTSLPIDNNPKDTIIISDAESSDLELIRDEETKVNQETELDISEVLSAKNEDLSKDSSNIIENSSSSEKVNKKKVQRIINQRRSFSLSKQKGALNANEVLVISDIENDLEQYFMNLNPHIEEENVKTAIEVLYLSLEEAFFLSYACNCLQIVDLSTNLLQIKDIWVLFQKSQPDFVEKYVAYHYFRAKGWVVKSGTKFGGDFLLYKKGPMYFHASYIVIVEVIKNGKSVKKCITWQKIFGMNRMAESATKEIIICYVFWPDTEKGILENHSILKEFKVTETLLRRWQATQEKTA